MTEQIPGPTVTRKVTKRVVTRVTVTAKAKPCPPTPSPSTTGRATPTGSPRTPAPTPTSRLSATSGSDFERLNASTGTDDGSTGGLLSLVGGGLLGSFITRAVIRRRQRRAGAEG